MFNLFFSNSDNNHHYSNSEPKDYKKFPKCCGTPMLKRFGKEEYFCHFWGKELKNPIYINGFIEEEAVNKAEKYLFDKGVEEPKAVLQIIEQILLNKEIEAGK